MAKKSKKVSKSDPTWDDATIDKHLKPTLAKKKIWWPDEARKKDLIALLKKNDVTLEEVMKGNKNRKYKRPEKPESEDESNEDEEAVAEEEEDEEEDTSRDSDDDDSILDTVPKNKGKQKKQKHAKEKPEVSPSEWPKVELDECEEQIWSGDSISTVLPNLARMEQGFTKELKVFSTIVKGNSPHSVLSFWFYSDYVVREYEDNVEKRNAAITKFLRDDRVWTRWKKTWASNPELWFRWNQFEKMERAKRQALGKPKTHAKAKSSEKARKSAKAKKNAPQRESSDEESDAGSGEEESASNNEGDDDDDDPPLDSDDSDHIDGDGNGDYNSDDDSDSDDDTRQAAYDSKARRKVRGLHSGKPADRMEVADPEHPKKTVMADIIGRHPSRKGWLVLALPSNNKKYPGLSRGYCVDGADAKYSKAFERYIEKGANRALSIGSNLNLKKCAPSEFELNFVTTIP